MATYVYAHADLLLEAVSRPETVGVSVNGETAFPFLPGTYTLVGEPEHYSLLQVNERFVSL